MSKEEYTDWDIYIRDNCTCRYCGFSGVGNFDPWSQLSIDHIVPTGNGGPDTPENKVVSCRRCNDLLHQFVPNGDSTEQRLASKLTHLQKKRSKEYKDYLLMMFELRLAQMAAAAASSPPPGGPQPAASQAAA